MKYKNLKYLFVVAFLLFLLPIRVFAASEIILTADKTDLEIGDEVTITAEMSEKDTKLYAFIATLSYDHSVFEEIETSNFVPENDTLDISYHSNTNKFGIINKTGLISNELFRVHLKVKEDANVGKTNVGLTNISSSDGNGKTTYEKAVVELSVARDAKDGEVLPTNTPNVIEDQEETIIKTFPIRVLSVVVTIAIVLTIAAIVALHFLKKDNKKVRNILIGILVALVLAFAYLSMAKVIRRDVNKDGQTDYDDAKEIMEYLLDIEGTEKPAESNKNNTQSNSGSNQKPSTNKTESQTENKKESNSKPSSTTTPSTSTTPTPSKPAPSASTTPTPSKPTPSASTTPTPSKPTPSASTTPTPSKPTPDDPNYDVDGDGDVDIDDVGGSTGGTTEDTKYSVQLEEIKDESKYIEKTQTSLSFTAKVSPTETIEKVMIDGKYYPVACKDSTCNVVVDAVKNAGVHEFKFTKAKLSNGREIDTKLTIKREVLKDLPYVDKFDVDYENHKFNFYLEDPEEAFLDGYVEIIDDAGETVLNEKISKENHFTQEFQQGKSYTIFVYASYDRDNDHNNTENYSENIKIYNHSFSVATNYNFKVNNVTITDAIEQGQKPTLTFTSSNSLGKKVEYIVVNGKQYPITKVENNTYTVVLEDFDTSKFGKYVLDIEEITLEDLKAFVKTEDYEIGALFYTVLKHTPTVENIQLKNNETEETITASYELTDKDETLKKLTAILVDSTEKELDRKEIAPEELNKDITLSYKDNKVGSYKVKFLAEYNLGTDRHNYTDKNIGENSILLQKDIRITNVTVSKVFPTKNEKPYQITFEVSVADTIKHPGTQRSYNTLSAVTINGLNYTAQKKKDFSSTVSFTVPSDSGIVKLEATRVQLQYEDYNNNLREYYSVDPYVFEIDVLKDAPSIENLKITSENYKEASATFEFDVVEDKGGFQSGTVELDGQSFPIKVGTNKVTFKNITLDKNLELTFRGTYDLDTNTLDQDSNQNYIENGVLHTVSYGLFDKTKYDTIALTGVEAVSKINNHYFEKNEPIKIQFHVEGIPEDLGLDVTKVVIDQKEYDIEKLEGKDQITLDGYPTAGTKEIVITNVILENGKNVPLKDSVRVLPEVLKDKVTIYDFKYEIEEENINLKIGLKDDDYSRINDEEVVVRVEDEDGNEIQTTSYSENIPVKRTADIVRYYVKVSANYDRDIIKQKGSDNYHEEELLNEVISMDKNYIELKDIANITLYKDDGIKSVEVEDVNIEDLEKNLSSYFVKIDMNKMPTVHAKIKKVLKENGRLILILDYTYVTKDNTTEKQDIRIDFGEIQDGTAHNQVRPDSLEGIIEEIKKNPNANITLKNDIDASRVNIDTLNYIDVEFTGTFDGNGHKIENLTKTLFASLKNASVKNLIIDNANLGRTSNRRAILANTATNTEIENVHIINSNIDADGSTNGNGIMFGDTRENITINQSSIINSSVSGGKRTGGFIGYGFTNVTISNSYITKSSVAGNWDAVGGIVGEVASANSVNMENCYSDVQMNVGGDTAKAGIIGYTSNSRITRLKNSISLADGNSGYRIHGNGITCTNCYELEESKMRSNANANIKAISKEEINSDFFKTTLGWDSKIWNLDNSSSTNLPMLKGEDYRTVNPDQLGDAYDEAKELLYQNLMTLMPFYDYSKILESGKNIGTDNLLAQQEIKHVVPVDANGKIVTYLTTENPKKIAKIKVVFKDGQKQEYEVRYDNTYDMVASYRIRDLKIDYTYNHYVINESSQLINNLTNYLMELTYEEDLDPLTLTVDSRLYRDYYQEVTKNELREFVLKYLSNSDYTITTNDEGINDYLEKEIKKDQKLEKMLYVYNYFRRFYSVDIDGIMLNDFILFNAQGFNKNLKPLTIAELYLAKDNNFATNRTSDAFNDTLGKYTGFDNIPAFLEYLVTSLSEKDPADWYKEQFKGYLVELEVQGRSDIEYRLWDHIKTRDTNTKVAWFNYALPIITIPEKAAYIISTPGQFIIGAQRTYIQNPFDSAQEEKLKQRIESYAVRMRDYYQTAAKLLGDTEADAKIFNDIHTVQIDKRYAYDSNGLMTVQNPYSTEEPFHKNFNEVIGQWAYADGNAATANGAYIIWRAEGVMDGNLIPSEGQVYEYTFHTWSHETAHNMDARIFLRNYGRRYDAGGEDYADGNLTQAFGNGDIIMNLSRHFEIGAEIASNLTPDRIDSPAKIHDFYKKLFETLYIMDYLEGRAFLELSPEEQAKLAVQVSYPNDKEPYSTDEKLKYIQNRSTRYSILTADDFKNMNLQMIHDLYTNHLVIYPGRQWETYNTNHYGGENIYKARWYQPHNDYGRPDSYSIKWLAYEMLGYAGFDNGYIEYYSNIHSEPKEFYKNDNPDQGIETRNYKSDLMALRTITKDDEMTFEKYKMMRFQEVENKLKYIQYINVDEVYNNFKEALRKDAASVTEAKNQKFENSNAVRRTVYFTIKNATNDFEGEVYNEANPKNVELNPEK